LWLLAARVDDFHKRRECDYSEKKRKAALANTQMPNGEMASRKEYSD